MLQAATIPVVVGIWYIYIRDKYEKEPWQMVVWGVLFGIYTTFVVYGLGIWIQQFDFPNTIVYDAFVRAALIEECAKLLFTYHLIVKNRECNEPFDCVVYASFVSLGFAWIENMVYVTHPILGGIQTAISRAFLSVPAHTLFGIQMGYYLSDWKFYKNKFSMIFAFFVPFLYHGWYDFLLMAQMPMTTVLFWILLVVLWYSSLKKMKRLLSCSPFRHV